MAKQFNFNAKIKQFEKISRTLPKRVGNVAKNHFLESFDNEGFSDGSINSDPWAKRKSKTKRDQTAGRRQLLIQSGALKRSIKVAAGPTFKKIAVGSYGINYAERHNKGLKGMPKRQFIGKSRILDKKIKQLIKNEMSKLL